MEIGGSLTSLMEVIRKFYIIYSLLSAMSEEGSLTRYSDHGLGSLIHILFVNGENYFKN